MTYTPAEVVLRDNSGGDGIGGKATLWRTENAIKVLFCAVDNDIISYGKKYNEPLWKGDTVEIFLTLGRRNRYLEFELEFIDEPPFKWEARRTEYGYECSFEIPFSTLKAIGFDENEAYFNLYMQDYTADGLRLYAMAPTMCGSFHRPEAFVKLAVE